MSDLPTNEERRGDLRFIPLIISIICTAQISCRTTDPSSSEFDTESASVVTWPVLDQTKFGEYLCKPATKNWSNDVAQINATLIKNPVPGSTTADGIIDVWYYEVGGFQLPPVSGLSCAMKQETEIMYSYDCMTDDGGEAKSVIVLDVSKVLDDGAIPISAFDVGLEASDSPLGVARNRDTERKLKCVPHVFPRKK
jgi:hypothetical protein